MDYKEKYGEIAEDLQWCVREYDNEVEIGMCSPAGEDFSIIVPKKAFVEDLAGQADDFDVEKHVAGWLEAKANGTSGVPGVVELVDDAKNIQWMLSELSAAVQNGMSFRDLEHEIDRIIDRIYHVSEDGCIRLDRMYGDEIGKDRLRDISDADSPMECLYEMLNEWESDNYIYSVGSLEDVIKDNLTNQARAVWNRDEGHFLDYINTYSFYYDPEDWNDDVNVNIMLDVGNANYDFTCDNVLNYSGDGTVDENSSILWLARQQGKETELREACVKRDALVCAESEVDRQTCTTIHFTDPFVDSCVQELENLSSSLGTITFLVHMKLLDFIKLREKMYADADANRSVRLEDRTGEGSITISKNAMCGLFDAWGGGGSVLAIALDKDVELPVKCIWDAEIETGKSRHGYSVDDVYGLIGSAWKGTVTLDFEQKEAKDA